MLKSKLQSKIDALSIMNSELDKCSMERDRYKLLVEQLKYKKSPSQFFDHEDSLYRFMPTNNISGGDMLAKTRDQNNMLKLEVSNIYFMCRSTFSPHLWCSGETASLTPRGRRFDNLGWSNFLLVDGRACSKFSWPATTIFLSLTP